MPTTGFRIQVFMSGCKDPVSESILKPKYEIFNDLTTVS